MTQTQKHPLSNKGGVLRGHMNLPGEIESILRGEWDREQVGSGGWGWMEGKSIRTSDWNWMAFRDHVETS